MANHDSPPPVLDSQRVVAHAIVDDLPYVQVSEFYVDGKLLGSVPRLVIAFDLNDEKPLLNYCGEQWEVLGVAGSFDTVDEARTYAERRYPGVETRWVEMNVSLEDALAYYDANGPMKCGFCGKRAYQIDQMVQGQSAAICGGCIKELSQWSSEDKPE